jgi:hypothetical protein
VHIAGVDQHYFEAALLEDFVERDPEDAGRFHRHGLNAAVSEPVGQPLKFGREAAELAHRLGVAIRWDRYEVAILPAIDPRRVRLDALEQRDRAPRFLAHALTLRVVLHRRLFQSEIGRRAPQTGA